MIVAVTEGEIRIRQEDGSEKDALGGKGFFEIMNNRGTLLVQTVELPEEINIRRAMMAEAEAREEKRQKPSIREYYS